MPVEQFFWTDDRIDHLKDNFVTTAEFEEVVENRIREERSRSSGRYLVRGDTSSGRYLCCIYERDFGYVFPITAYEPSPDV